MSLIRIASTAYRVPDTVDTVAAVMERESPRVEAALSRLSPSLRKRVVAGLGLERVRLCDNVQPYELALQAATSALADAELAPRDLDLIIDFSTLPGAGQEHFSFAQRLAADLKAETSLNFGFKVGGCAGLHLAFKAALALMGTDEGIRNALLVTADSPPSGSRSLLPVTIQGDAAGVVVLTRDEEGGARVLDSQVVTLGHLHDAISIAYTDEGHASMVIHVDSRRIENEVMPIYYLNFHRLVHKVLGRAGLGLADVDHFVYSNISQTDRDGFIRSLKIPAEKVPYTTMAEYGHTFAADLIINYTDLSQAGCIEPGQMLLFASAGIGFTWGVSLVRA